MVGAIFHGMILAFGLILPLGAQNVFVFNQGVIQPRLKKAFPVILTASLCDTLLILLAVVGVSVVVLKIPSLQLMLYSFGLIFLSYMGWNIWRTTPPKVVKEGTALSPKKQIMFALSVSLLNPHAILDTIGVIGTSSLSYSGGEKIGFAAACIGVSWVWFLGLAILGKAIGHLDQNGKILRGINKISAIMIWTMAIYLLIELFKLL